MYTYIKNTILPPKHTQVLTTFFLLCQLSRCYCFVYGYSRNTSDTTVILRYLIFSEKSWSLMLYYVVNLSDSYKLHNSHLSSLTLLLHFRFSGRFSKYVKMLISLCVMSLYQRKFAQLKHCEKCNAFFCKQKNVRKAITTHTTTMIELIRDVDCVVRLWAKKLVRLSLFRVV